MQMKENTNSATILLDKEEDFSSKSLAETMKKISTYKKLPFHDVILAMDSKNFVRFWENARNIDMKFKQAETKNDVFSLIF